MNISNITGTNSTDINNLTISNVTEDVTEMNSSSFFIAESNLEKIFCRTILPITSVAGIIGIILTVVVLTRKNMCTSTNCYLKALAITDLIFLSLLTTRFLNEYFANTPHFLKVHIYLEYLAIFLHLFTIASTWLTVMVSIERYIAICYPLRAVSLSTVSGARRFIGVIYLVVFLCELPKFWETRVAHLPEIGHYIEVTELRDNTDYILAYRILFEGVFSTVLPFLCLIAINSRLIQEIHRSTRYLRHHLAVNSTVSHVVSAEQLQLTLMLIGITLVFFLCQAPYMVFTIIGVINNYRLLIEPGHDTMWLTFQVVNCVNLLLLGIKSSINFILYCWFSEKFRVTFKRLFCMPNCLTIPQMRRLSNNSHNHTHRNSYHISKETTY